MRRHHHHWRRHGPMRRYLGARLHRRLFVLLGASMVPTAVVVGAVQLVTAGPGCTAGTGRSTDRAAGRGAVRGRVGRAPRRDHLASRLHEVLGMSVVVRDAGGAVIGQYGPACDRPDFRADAVRGGSTLGQVAACGGHRGNGTFVVAVFVLGVMLWGSAGMIARRLVGGSARSPAWPTRSARASSTAGCGPAAVTSARSRCSPKPSTTWPTESSSRWPTSASSWPAYPRDPFSPRAHARAAGAGALEWRGRPGARRDRARGAGDRRAGRRAARQLAAGLRRGRRARSTRRNSPPARSSARACPDRCSRRAQRRIPAIRRCSRARSRTCSTTPPATPAARRASTWSGDGGIRFIVEDAGPGIPEGDLPRVFESFVRGERGGASSLGLGLALVRRIAEAHGGARSPRTANRRRARGLLRGRLSAATGLTRRPRRAARQSTPGTLPCTRRTPASRIASASARTAARPRRPGPAAAATRRPRQAEGDRQRPTARPWSSS